VACQNGGVTCVTLDLVGWGNVIVSHLGLLRNFTRTIGPYFGVLTIVVILDLHTKVGRHPNDL
jgi:hypothetical protein